jgi:hypothetical protein
MTGNSKLFSFIFLTLKSSANDPESKDFLPPILSDIESGGSLLLPLTQDSWTIGTLTGDNGLLIGGIIADQYFLIHDQPAILYPKNPYPSLNLKDAKDLDKVIINGLENVYVTDYTNYNYDVLTETVTADIKMQFNYWTNNPGRLKPGQKITPLSINTPFILTQNLCLSKTRQDKECRDPIAAPVQIVGEGTFTTDITQINFTASIRINVAENRTGLNISINNILLEITGDEAPAFENIHAQLITESDYQEIITEAITTFMSAQEASTAVFLQMQDLLNQPVNIAALSAAINEQFTLLLDSILGPVTGTLPNDDNQQTNNKVDLYLFDRIRYSLNNPASNWYVQTLLKNYQHPSLNPYLAPNLDIGSINLSGVTLSDVILSDIVVTGLPNSTVPAESMILSPPTLTNVLLIGSLDTGTSATANFSATYSGGTLKFGMEVTLKSASLNCTVTPDGNDVDSLVITFNSIIFQIPDSSSMQITISEKTGLGPVVQKLLNTPEVQEKIITAINYKFEDYLPEISIQVTTLVKALLTQQLINT